MKKISFLIFVSIAIMSFTNFHSVEKEWEEIGTAAGVNFAWRVLSPTQGEVKLKNVSENQVSVAGGFQIKDLEKVMLKQTLEYDILDVSEQKVVVFTDSTSRLEYATEIRLKQLDIRVLK